MNELKVPKGTANKFESCPNFKGRAVCVDITPLEKRMTPYGEKEQFRFAFEVDLKRSDGNPFCVWSGPLSLSLDPKSNLRKMLENWRGTALTKEELEDEFDLAPFLGAPCWIWVAQEPNSDGSAVYSNIKGIGPNEGGEPLSPSGTFVRKKDREKKNGGTKYERSEQIKGQETARSPWQSVKCVASTDKFDGMELGDLDMAELGMLLSNWLPLFDKGEVKNTPNSRKLAEALRDANREIESMKAAEEEDVPPM